MESETRLLRAPEDRELPSSILEPEEKANHRPRTSYRLVIHTADDVEKARKVHIPIFALRDSTVTMLGYPMRFPTLVLLPRPLRNLVKTDLPTIEFQSEDAIRNPHIEDVIVALLRFDPLAARALAERNQDLLERNYLLKRILQEDVEEQATRVRFQDLLPSLPPRGEPLPQRSLERVISANAPKGLIP